jgi:hypothetical protein
MSKIPFNEARLAKPGIMTPCYCMPNADAALACVLISIRRAVAIV